MKFNCSDCGQKLEVETIYAGQNTACPSCGADVLIPVGEPAMKPAEINTAILETLVQPPSDPAAAEPSAGGEMTIAQFMSDRKLDGGVSLTEDVLTSDQNRKYEYGDVVARGGMGAILKAGDQNIRREVAMKVLLDPTKASELEILRFIEEAQVTGQLEHPSVVPVHDLGVDAVGNVFYTMKYVRGLTLHAILMRISKNDRTIVEEYPLGKLLTIFQKICDAMAFAHSKSVIHRDLKPENVMVGEFGEVLVMDWGLAKVLGREGDDRWASAEAIDSVRNQDASGALATVAGTVFGTPQFMAPEQAKGDTRAMDPRTDVYALGAILYNILVLRPPVEGKTIDEVLTKVSNGEIATPTTYNTAKDPKRVTKVPGLAEKVRLRHLPAERVPEALAAVAMKAMTKDSDKRYQDVQQLQNDIEAFQGGFATQAEDAGTIKQLSLFVKRNKLATLSAAAIAILGIGFLVTAYLGSQKIVSVSREAAPEFVDKAREALEGGRPEDSRKAVDTALALHEKSPAAWLELGRLQFDADDYPNATGSFARAQTLAGESDVELRNQATAFITFIQEWRPKIEESGGDPTPDQVITMAPQLEALDPVLAGRLYARVGDQEQALRIQIENAMGQLLSANPGLEWKPAPEGEDWPMGIHRFYWHHIFRDTGMQMHVPPYAVDQSKLVNIQPLARLPFVMLNFEASGVSDISSLGGMKTLRSLHLGNSPILSLEGIQGAELEGLNVAGTQIEDLSPLRGMSLKRLDIGGTKVTDISALAGLQLEHISLDGLTKVESVEALQGMPLTWVNFDGTHSLTSIEPLRGAPVEFLDLRQAMELRDISPLAEMPLKTLAIGTRYCEDLSVLHGKELESLTIQIDLEDVDFLNHCQVSDGLNLYMRDLASLDGVQSQTELTWFLFHGGPNPRVTNLEALRGLPLKSVSLRDLNIADLSALEDAELDSATLVLPNLTDISFLRGMDLKEITIGGPITDFSPLEGMRNLTTIYAQDCTDATDFRVMATLPRLGRLVLPKHIKGSDVEYLRGKEGLNDLGHQSHYGAERWWREQDAAAEQN